MKKNLLMLSLILLIALFSCNNNNTKETLSTNDLLPKNVSSEYEFINVNNTFNHWTENFKAKEFYTSLYNFVIEGNIKVYDYNGKEESIDKVKISFGDYNDTVMIENAETFEIETKVIERKVDFDKITGMYFKENWFFNESEFKFTKEIIEYYPVLTKLSNIDTNAYSKFLGFAVRNNEYNIDNEKILASGIISEYCFNDTLESTILSGMDINKFREVLINRAYESKNVYNPDNLETMSKDDIDKSLGLEEDTIIIEDPETGETSKHVIQNTIYYDEVENIIFIEDWYLDENNYSIRKEIVGIAPVMSIYKYHEDETEVSKRIPFVYYFSDRKPLIIN